MKIFIALPNTYFDVGTEADLVERVDRECGLFFGLKDGHFTETICKYKEFKVSFISDKGERIAGGDHAEKEYD